MEGELTKSFPDGLGTAPSAFCISKALATFPNHANSHAKGGRAAVG